MILELYQEVLFGRLATIFLATALPTKCTRLDCLSLKPQSAPVFRLAFSNPLEKDSMPAPFLNYWQGMWMGLLEIFWVFLLLTPLWRLRRTIDKDLKPGKIR